MVLQVFLSWVIDFHSYSQHLLDLVDITYEVWSSLPIFIQDRIDFVFPLKFDTVIYLLWSEKCVTCILSGQKHKLCLTFHDLMDCSMLVSSVLHCVPEFAQMHVH